MNSPELREIWLTAGAAMFELYGQTVRWSGRNVTAIVDSVPFSAEQRDGGGGLLADFAGSIVFLKSDFTAPAPAVGDRVEIGGRFVRLATYSCKEDDIDPTITFLYEATEK